MANASPPSTAQRGFAFRVIVSPERSVATILPPCRMNIGRTAHIPLVRCCLRATWRLARWALRRLDDTVRSSRNRLVPTRIRQGPSSTRSCAPTTRETTKRQRGRTCGSDSTARREAKARTRQRMGGRFRAARSLLTAARAAAEARGWGSPHRRVTIGRGSPADVSPTSSATFAPVAQTAALPLRRCGAPARTAASQFGGRR